jgi:hypothetical protein
MVDRASKAPSLFTSFLHLGRAIRNLFRTMEGKDPIPALDPEPHQDELAAQLALPPAESHSEAAQLLAVHVPNWHTPVPSTLPVPTYAPVMTAFGVVFIALGAVTVWPISIIGTLIFVFAIAQWIGELLP